MGDNTITGPPFSQDVVDEKATKIFFINFDSSVPREKVLRKNEMRKLVSSRKLKGNQV